jgi:hypothetical protein
MKINYTVLFIIMFGIFVVNRNMNQGFTYDNLINITEKSSGDITKNPTNPSIQEKIKETIVKINDLSPIKIKGLSEEKDPVSIIHNNYEQVIDTTKFEEKKDFISPNPEDSTEYRFIDENMKTAWSEVDVSQHPKHYTSDIQDEKINIAGFFNNEQFFHDSTSPNSNTILPERCSITANNEVLCDYNNRLQLIPPKLISNSETNPVLNSIGSDKLYQTIDSTKVGEISGNNYQVWEYENEKSMNGGKYFQDVYGASAENESYMELGTIKPNYSF